MRLIRYFIIIALLPLYILYFCHGAGAENNISSEQYYLSLIKGIKSGYTHITTQVSTEGDKKLITTTRHSEMGFKRMGFKFKLVQDVIFIEDSEGNPVSVEANIDNQGEKITLSAKFSSPDKATLVTTVNNIPKTENIDLKQPVIFPYAIQKLYKNSDKDILEYATIDPTNDFRVIKIKAQKAGSESLDSDGLQGEFVKYKTGVSALPGVESTQWIDKEGNLAKEKISLLGLEQIVTTKNNVLYEDQNFDMFKQSLVEVKAHIPNPDKLEFVSYRIDTTADKPEDLFLSDERQKVQKINGNKIYLKINNQPDLRGKFSYPVNADNLGEYLDSGPFITSADEELVKQAKAVAGDEKDAYVVAKTMEKWVYDNITSKDLSVNFANASDTLKSKEGDCTEHSVLLAALLRAAGIPSRVVAGLVYTSMPKDSFAYHMWTEAYIGSWISLEPSFSHENFSPTHIAVYKSSLNNLSDKTDLMLGILKIFSKIKINVLEYSSIDKNIIGIAVSGSESAKENSASGDIVNIKMGGQPETTVNINLKSENTDQSLIKNVSLSGNDDMSDISPELKRKYMDEYIRSGFYNFSRNKIQDSVNDFNKAAKLIPYNDDFSLVKLAVKLSSLGMFNLASSHLKNVKDNDIWKNSISSIKNIYFPDKIPSDEDEIILSEALSRINYQNDLEGGINLLKNGNILSKYDFAHYLYAKALAGQKQYSGSIDEFIKAIDSNPSNLGYRLELARVYNKKGDFKKARKELEYILKQNIPDKKFIELVNTELYWSLFADNRRDTLKSQYYYARYYKSKGELKSATDVLTKLVRTYPEETDIYELLGDIYAGMDQPNDAKASYLNVLKYDKRSPKALIGLGNIYKRTNKYKEALDYYLKAEKIDPENPEVIVSLADCYNLLSQEEIAYKYWDKILRLDPNNFYGNYNIGLMYLNSGKNDLSAQYFKKALSINPESLYCWLNLARIEFEKNNYFLAKTYLDDVRYLDESNNIPQYYYYLGLIYSKMENYSSAKTSFKKAVELKADYSEAKKELEKLAQ